jgi:hypothetical protein
MKNRKDNLASKDATQACQLGKSPESEHACSAERKIESILRIPGCI